MVGKSPHRREGKTKDAEHMGPVTQAGGMPLTSPSPKRIAQENAAQMRMRGGPTRLPAEEQIGGSRPGVPSRVRRAIEEREE